MAVDDSYSKLLLHCDGSDASTTITDEAGKTVTAVGNAQLDTAQKKFGTASILLDGTGDKLTVPNSADWDFGTGDFTIDFWFRANAITSYDTWFSLNTAAAPSNTNFYKFDIGAVSGTTAKPRFYASISSTAVAGYEMTSAIDINDGSFHHFALVRNGTSVYIFFDGVSQALTTITAISTNNISTGLDGALYIGDDIGNTPREIDGWMDEIRVSKGIARWTSNFTPPTVAYAPANVTLVVDTMALALTYANVTLTKATKLIVDTMSLSLTFADVTFLNARTLVVDTMALTLNYANVTLTKATKLVVGTMAIAITFKDVILRKIGWNNDTKPTSNWTEDSKPASSWTNDTK